MFRLRKFLPAFRSLPRNRRCPTALALLPLLIVLSCPATHAQDELVKVTIRSTFNAGQPVDSVAISPDGRWGAVGTKSGGVGVFSLDAAGQPRWVAHNKGRVNVLAFNRPGNLLAAAGDDAIVDLVNPATGQARALTGHKHKVWALAFSPDGQVLASGGDDKEIIVWDANTGTELYRLTRDTAKAILYLGFNAMGTTLLAADETGVISEWDVKNRSRLRQLTDSDKTLYSAGGNFSGSMLAVGVESSAMRSFPTGGISPSDLIRERRVKLYDTDKLEVAKTIDQIAGEVAALSVSADSHYVAVARQQVDRSYLSVYDIQHGNEIVSFPGNVNLNTVAFSADGQSLASGDDSGEVRLYAIQGIAPGNDAGDITGIKFTVSTSQPTSLIPADSKLILGVMDFDANGVDPATAQTVAELLHTRIAANSSVTLVERAKVEQLLHEQDFQNSNRADSSTAARLGQLLGARKMIFGSVGKLGSTMIVHTEIVDVETGKVDGSIDVTCQRCTVEDLPDAVAKMKHYLVADSH